jgi:hypothetical protein
MTMTMMIVVVMMKIMRIVCLMMMMALFNSMIRCYKETAKKDRRNFQNSQKKKTFPFSQHHRKFTFKPLGAFFLLG